MTYLVVTTMHADGLKLYGRRMIESFKLWPLDVARLIVYAEGWNERFEGVEVRDLETSSDWLPYFKHRHAWRETDNYRMDAVRFSHKIAALLHADRDARTDYLVWLDADTVTHTRIPAAFLDEVSPKGEWISWLDRRRMYPECGFYIIDRRHARHAEAMNALRGMYANDDLFRLKEWHDSYVLQQVVLGWDLPAKSISGPVGYRTGHPFVNSRLGAYMDHMKGKRKEKGRSNKSDLFVKRDEVYWR